MGSLSVGCGGGGSTDATSTAQAAQPTAKTTPPNTTVQAQSADLCQGLVTDQNAHPMTDVAQPAALASFVDPQFGTTIRRLTNAGAGNIIKPAYSTIQAWNADESFMILYHTVNGSGGPTPVLNGQGHHLYNGKTYQYIKKLNISPSDLEQFFWDPTNPKIVYWTSTVEHTLYKTDVTTDINTPIRNFDVTNTTPGQGGPCTPYPAQDLNTGTDPMYISWDGTKLGFTCGINMFTYDIKNNVVGKVVALATGTGSQNAPQAAPSGQRYFLNNNDTQGTSRDANLNTLLTLDIANSGEHASMGMTAAGRDTFYSVQFDPGPLAKAAGKDNTGTLVADDMVDGSWRVLIGPSKGWPYPPSGTHISALAYKNPGWVAVDVLGQVTNGKLGQLPLESEIILANTNPGSEKVCRVGHHRSCGGIGTTSGLCSVATSVGYFAEPHNVISPSGTRILYGSDWNGQNQVDTYVVELPSYKP